MKHLLCNMEVNAKGNVFSQKYKLLFFQLLQIITFQIYTMLRKKTGLITLSVLEKLKHFPPLPFVQIIHRENNEEI